MSNYARKFWCLLTLWLFIYSISLVAIDLTVAKFTIPPVTPTKYLMHFAHDHFSYILPFLYVVNLRIQNTYWKKAFSYKTWFFPFLTIITIAVYQWQFGTYTNLNGLRWSWPAILEWAVLFISSLFLYQKRGVNNFDAGILSYLSVYLGGLLYEIPFVCSYPNWLNTTFLINYGLSLATFSYILFRYKLKFKPKLLLTLIPIALLWIFYFNIKFEWLLRLPIFPLMLSLPFLISKKLNAEKEEGLIK